MDDILTALVEEGANFGVSVAAAKHPDLRTGWGREADKELPVYKDWRFNAAALDAIATVAGVRVPRVLSDAAKGARHSLVTTEAMRYQFRRTLKAKQAALATPSNTRQTTRQTSRSRGRVEIETDP